MTKVASFPKHYSSANVFRECHDFIRSKLSGHIMLYSSLSVNSLQSWAHLNNVKLSGVQVATQILAKDGSDRGGGLLATKDLGPSDVLLTIPHDLVLNVDSIKEATRIDSQLRQILDAVGPASSQNPRLAIMIMILVQLTYASPDLEGKVTTVLTPFTDYVKFLPKDIPLPTRYTVEQQQYLTGTSLDVALKQKLLRLELEFDHLKSATQEIDWCQQLWWDEDEGILTLDDWKNADSIYRSRALDLPRGIGDSMVPVLDMANHGSGDKYNARFELDEDSNTQLVVRDDTSIQSGDEITIMYGCGGACEMIFSYGFLEPNVHSAREMFLDLRIPDDDPLKRAKIEFAKEAPGVRLYVDDSGQTRWDSAFVWWTCVNKEDGLDFRIIQQNDGSTEVQATWNDVAFDASTLEELLMANPSKEIFQLRATVLVQDRVEMQGAELASSQEMFDAARDHGDGPPILDTTNRLRELEMELLTSAYQSLEEQKSRLLESEAVRMYLNQQWSIRAGGAEDDFS